MTILCFASLSTISGRTPRTRRSFREDILRIQWVVQKFHCSHHDVPSSLFPKIAKCCSSNTTCLLSAISPCFTLCMLPCCILRIPIMPARFYSWFNNKTKCYVLWLCKIFVTFCISVKGFCISFITIVLKALVWMLKSCESLQVLCRRAIIRAVGSRKRLRRLPLPRNIINWLREYDEPAAFDPNCSSDEVVFSNNNETITFTGHMSLYTYQLICSVGSLSMRPS